MNSLLTAIAVVLACGSASLGAVLKVPEDHKTIPEAVAAAAAGDTILIAPGTYTLDSLQVAKKLVMASNHINSQDDGDIDNTIIKPSPKARKQWFDLRATAGDTKIIGLTILGNEPLAGHPQQLFGDTSLQVFQGQGSVEL